MDQHWLLYLEQMFQTLVPVLFRSQSREIWKRPKSLCVHVQSIFDFGWHDLPWGPCWKIGMEYSQRFVFFLSVVVSCCILRKRREPDLGRHKDCPIDFSYFRYNLTIIRPLVTHKAFQGAAIYIYIYINIIYTSRLYDNDYSKFEMIDSWLLCVPDLRICQKSISGIAMSFNLLTERANVSPPNRMLHLVEHAGIHNYDNWYMFLVMNISFYVILNASCTSSKAK